VPRWDGLEQIPRDWGRSVATVGVFDGVHRGHQYVVGRAVQCGRGLGLPVVVVTFDPNPLEVIRPGSHPPVLTTVDRRVELLHQAGADAVLVLPFTRELSQQAAPTFVVEVLVRKLHVAAIVVGKNFRYGHRAAGDVALLEQLGDEYGFSVEGLDLVAEGAESVSSTQIRDLIESGDVAATARALGRPHRVEGIVVEGDRRGRKLGFPTANLETIPYAAIPADGIYAGWLIMLGTAAGPPPSNERRRLPAAISIGTNPTFAGTERQVEAYALDRTDLELYGERVAFDFAERLRDTLRFASVEALIEQMDTDVARTRQIVG
jgi:riboflavin kinase/FMN adenylyltransferase